uniref:Uncharacterized protein n=1 Tax=Anguilla anguilla TaxID=7936 RepID=A0A0E9QH50_ANGAN
MGNFSTAASDRSLPIVSS